MHTHLEPKPLDWRHIGGQDTAQEIAHQPRLWRALASQLIEEQDAILGFLGNWLLQPSHRVILTGAGSSAFVGEIVADELNAAWPAQIRAVSTTSLLTHPELYLERGAPTLLVSFARSGNSPESLAAVELLRHVVSNARFLNITCNADGQLARQGAGQADSFNLLMPPGSCDLGFAMTSSFSCMLLAALSVLGRAGLRAAQTSIEQLATQADMALRDWTAPVQALANERFDRIIYLGSGPLEALAKEAALKVLELTSGRALALANTPLGFRHGPKSALNKNSLVVVLRSCKPLAQAYEQDLLNELHRDQVAGLCLSVGPAETGAEFSCTAPNGSDAWLAPLWLLAPQLLSLHKSAALGLTPDNPFPNGTVNRVVQGVTIHPHESL